MQDNRAQNVVDEPSDDDIAALLDNAPDSPHTALRSLLRNAFSRIADAEFSRDNAARLLCDGPANYPVWLAAIAEAKCVVHLENYIIDDDAVGQEFADALMRAAARGVKCRVLYDWLGCGIRTPRRFWRMLRDGGVEVRCYNPPRLTTPVAWISRDHRKLLTVDGTVAFAGGLCISKHWASDPARNRTAWRDTAVEIRGPAVHHLEAAFADSWAAAGPPLPPEDLSREDLPPAARKEDAAEDAAAPAVPIGDVPPSQSTDFIGPLDLWVVAGRPDNMGLYRLQQMIASTVKHRLWLADAYFVATTGYVNTLTDAARAGVDVRLLVPGSSDVPLIKALSLAEYRPLLEAGVRVFEWNGPMMHAKTTVADSCWARVGSSNSNLASWISNRELDITIDDRVFARAMEAMYLRDLRNCTEIVLQAGKVRPGGGYVAQAEEEADLPPAPVTASNWRSSGRNPIGRGSQRANAGRLLAGTIGAGSSIGASISQHRALTPTEARVLAVGGLVLVALGLIAVFAPKLIAYPLAVIAAWLGIALLLRAWRLRFPKRSMPGTSTMEGGNHASGGERTRTGERRL